GYANAAGAFFALASVAALMVACSVRGAGPRAASVLAAIGFATVPILRDSLAPTALLVLGPVALLLAREEKGDRPEHQKGGRGERVAENRHRREPDRRQHARGTGAGAANRARDHQRGDAREREERAGGVRIP